MTIYYTITEEKWNVRLILTAYQPVKEMNTLFIVTFLNLTTVCKLFVLDNTWYNSMLKIHKHLKLLCTVIEFLEFLFYTNTLHTITLFHVFLSK